MLVCRALCEQHSYDEDITRLLDRCEVNLFPSLNPDGFCNKTRNNANNKAGLHIYFVSNFQK